MKKFKELREEVKKKQTEKLEPIPDVEGQMMFDFNGARSAREYQDKYDQTYDQIFDRGGMSHEQIHNEVLRRIGNPPR